ncbi:MAG TPA: hypothetical protein P5267_01260 [Patescibacteria group bacterium]|nr:hypothetical protein [Patescibacteria group bacterium]
MNNIIFETKTIIANRQDLDSADRERLLKIVEALEPDVLSAFWKLISVSPNRLLKINELFKAKEQALASGDLSMIDKIIKTEGEYLQEKSDMV